jgi:hypothetical protein
MNGSRSVALWASWFVLVLAAAAQPVLSGDTVMRRGGPRQGLPDHVAAFAALEPVGGETGWGRIVVRDDLLPNGVHRSVQVWLHELQPQMPYQVEAQGVVLGTVRTDRQGHAWLKLQSSGQGHDVVPEALPPAGDIVSAQVRDELLAPALEGTFSVVRHHEADLVVYEDKTELEDVTGGDAVGMACVRVKQSGAQQLVTRASRLVPGEVFRVVVDGVLAGVVTADEEGQAWMELESPDDDNPLPLELQPVTEIELVQWFHDDSLLLMGSFTGEDDDEEEEECEEVRGVILEVGEKGFVLQAPAKVEGRTVKVAVTEETRFKGFEELADLDEGDVVVVEGCWDGEVLVAKWVALAEDDDTE